jgi:hypothetical protein
MACLTFQRLEGLYSTMPEPKRRLTNDQFCKKTLVTAGIMGNCNKMMGSDNGGVADTIRATIKVNPR